MKHRITLALVFASCFLLPQFVFSAAFDDIPPGARGKGAGTAFTAGADDSSAVYWNPSMLAKLKKGELGCYYQDLYGLGLLNYSFISYAHPGVGRGTIGFGWIRMGTSASVGFMNYAENTLIFSYGQKVAPGWLVGVNIKYFSVAYDVKASGYGFDAALTRYFYNDRVRIALMWYNLNNPLIRWETLAVDRIPSTLKLGTSFEFARSQYLYIDLKRKSDKQADFAFGWEGRFSRNIGLRMGAARQDGKLNTSIGASAGYKNLRFDYAMEKHYALGYNNVFSLTYGF